MYERKIKFLKNAYKVMHFYLILCLKSYLCLLIWGKQFVKAYNTYSNINRVVI